MWRLRQAGELRARRAELGDLAPRLWWLRQLVLLAAGRPVRCASCGEVAFVGVPFVWRGRLTVLGASAAWVRVDWHSTNALRFRHLELDRCRSR